MAVNPALALDDLADGFQFEITTGLQSAGAMKFSPVREILPRRRKAVRDEHRHAHASLRKARVELLAPIGLLHVFAEREFDARRRVAENQLLRRIPVAQFDHAVLAADGIGRAVQQIHRRHAARELLVQIFRLRIHHIANAHHRGARQAGLVHVAENRRVAVTVNDAGRDRAARRVHDEGVGACIRPKFADAKNLPAGNHHLRVRQNAERTACPHGRVGEQDDRRIRDRAAAVER